MDMSRCVGSSTFQFHAMRTATLKPSLGAQNMVTAPVWALKPAFSRVNDGESLKLDGATWRIKVLRDIGIRLSVLVAIGAFSGMALRLRA